MKIRFIIKYDFYENRNYEFLQKNTKIVMNILQQNSDDKYVYKEKINLKFQIPTACGLNMKIIKLLNILTN